MQSSKNPPASTSANTTSSARRASSGSSRSPMAPSYPTLPLSPREAFLVAEVERAYRLLGSQMAIRTDARYGMPTEEPRSTEPEMPTDFQLSGYASRSSPIDNEVERAYRNYTNQLMAQSSGRFSMMAEPRSWTSPEEFRTLESVMATQYGLPTFGTRAPLADVEDEGENFRIRVELPGASKDNVSVRVYDRSVEIRHAVPTETSDRETTRVPLLSERSRGRFQRTLHLPEAVLAEKTAATFENGILELTLPKASPAPEIAIR